MIYDGQKDALSCVLSGNGKDIICCIVSTDGLIQKSCIDGYVIHDMKDYKESKGKKHDCSYCHKECKKGKKCKKCGIVYHSECLKTFQGYLIAHHSPCSDGDAK